MRSLLLTLSLCIAANALAAPVWFVNGRLTGNGHAMLSELLHADERGLRARDYDGAALQAAVAMLPPGANGAQIDTLNSALSRSIERFASDLHSGRVVPRQLGYDLDVPHSQIDLSGVLEALAITPSVQAEISTLEPPFRHYQLLVQALRDWPLDSEQRRKIELTLERIRWLPARIDSPPIIVNIPQFKLFAFRTTEDLAQDILPMDVIVGAAFKERETPVFAADMRYVVLQPYWDVPMSIMRQEFLPLMLRDPKWVEQNDYEIVRGQTDAANVMPATAETIKLLAQGKLRLRQKPGPRNALGFVKFMLPNPHNVYLHDTPAQSLFKQTKRAFSHGCIRVSNPRELLEHVLRDDPAWTPARIDAALQSGEMRRIPLRKPIHVFIIYATALATERGETLFFDNIYRHDERLLRALDVRSAQLNANQP